MPALLVLVVLLLVAMFSAVVHLERSAECKRSQAAIDKSCLGLEVMLSSVSRQVGVEGYKAMPIGQQSIWESMVWFCVDAKTGLFTTPPRFEPVKSRVEEALAEGYDGPDITCETKQFKLAVRTGERVKGVFDDYRCEPVLSVAELVEVDGNLEVIFVEVDEAEAIKGTHSNHQVSVTVGGVGFLIALILIVIYQKHRKQDVELCSYEIAAEKLNREVRRHREKAALIE